MKNELKVEVVASDIIITRPGDPSLKVTYRRELGTRMLVSDDILYSKKLTMRPEFLASAWRAAFDKAKSLGWL
jgi:hypothetical protein